MHEGAGMGHGKEEIVLWVQLAEPTQNAAMVGVVVVDLGHRAVSAFGAMRADVALIEVVTPADPKRYAALADYDRFNVDRSLVDRRPYSRSL